MDRARNVLLALTAFAPWVCQVIAIEHHALAGGVFSSDWETLYNGPGPIRSITRAANGDLLGMRSTGERLELWRSTREGADWSLSTIVANSRTVEYGDPMIASARFGTQEKLFAAYREQNPSLGFRLGMSVSDDGGASWSSAGTIHDWTPWFVGAPFLFQLSDGTLQAYYDSEVLPAAAGQPGNQWIGMKTGTLATGGLWSWNKELVASRSPDPSTPTRDGLPTVVMLAPDPDQQGRDRIMLVTEGIDSHGGLDSNVVRASQSFSGGKTQQDWDFVNQRRTAYQSPAIDSLGRRYNAYAPYAIRVGEGPVMVAFSTDEDRADELLPADMPNTPVEKRHSHIKWARTLDTFEAWSDATTLWDENDRNYSVGLFERSFNDVVATLDMFDGVQKTLQPAPELLADFDTDDDVDGHDFIIWQRGFGITGDATRSDGDANHDGAVDVADLVILNDEFGSVASTSSPLPLAVPEPSVAMLCLASLVMMLFRNVTYFPLFSTTADVYQSNTSLLPRAAPIIWFSYALCRQAAHQTCRTIFPSAAVGLLLLLPTDGNAAPRIQIDHAASFRVELTAESPIGEASIREHSIVWHPGRKKYYLVADVVPLGSPHHPNTYNTQLHLWSSSDLTGWTYHGIAVEKGKPDSSYNGYGTASPAGMVYLNGLLYAPFSARRTARFEKRSIGLAISDTDPEKLPWTKTPNPISDLPGEDDDPALWVMPGDDSLHLFHRRTSPGGYRIVHTASKTPLESDSWPVARAVTPSPPGVRAQELTGVFAASGRVHLLVIEHLVAGEMRIALLAADTPVGPFKPAEPGQRYLPTDVQPRRLAYGGHITPVIRDGSPIAFSWTVPQKGNRYGLQGHTLLDEQHGGNDRAVLLPE